MQVDRFLERATHPDVEVDPAKLRAVVQEAASLAQARETMRTYAWNQAAADRIIQELVLEDERVNREEFAAQMPLIEPRNESGSQPYVDDLSPMGEHRYIFRDKSETESVEIVRQQFEFVGLHEDGTTAANWTDVDSIDIPEDEISKFESLIKSCSIDGSLF